MAVHFQGAVVALIAVASASCTGEQVSASTIDSGVADSVADSAVADSVADSAVADSVADSADGGGCGMPGNLVPEGDFTDGVGSWFTDSVSIRAAEGRCGGGMQVLDVKGSGRVGKVYFGLLLAKGTRLHARAWFKKGAAPIAPDISLSLLIRSTIKADGGMLSDDYLTNVTLSADWTMAEKTFTLTRDQDELEVFVDTYRAMPVSTAGDFYVDEISVVVEK